MEKDVSFSINEDGGMYHFWISCCGDVTVADLCNVDTGSAVSSMRQCPLGCSRANPLGCVLKAEDLSSCRVVKRE